MLHQPVLIGNSRCLVDERCAITQKHGTLALLHGLITDPQAQIGLAGPGGSHDQLVLVALPEASPEALVRIELEGTGCRESIITPAWR